MEEEAAGRLERRTRGGVVGYGYGAYTAEDLLREYLKTEVARQLADVRGVAGGRGWRGRLRSRYGELAH